jgi:hypothetical protein
MGTPRAPVEEPAHQRHLALLRERLGPDAFAAAWAAGQALTPEAAVAYALEADSPYDTGVGREP